MIITQKTHHPVNSETTINPKSKSSLYYNNNKKIFSQKFKYKERKRPSSRAKTRKYHKFWDLDFRV
jgi:hypothetical protein